MFHLMLEAVALFEEIPAAGRGTTRETSLTLSPGFRGGWNVGRQQLITGVALPLTLAEDEADVGVLLYFSYELPFRK